MILATIAPVAKDTMVVVWSIETEPTTFVAKPHTAAAAKSFVLLLLLPGTALPRLGRLRHSTGICASTFCGCFCILLAPEEEQHYDMPNFDTAT